MLSLMSSVIGPVFVTGLGVAAIAGENVINGHDPVPALFAGSMVMFATSIMAEWRESLAMAFAVVFMLGAILSHPAAYSKLFGNVVKLGSTSATTKG